MLSAGHLGRHTKRQPDSDRTHPAEGVNAQHFQKPSWRHAYACRETTLLVVRLGRTGACRFFRKAKVGPAPGRASQPRQRRDRALSGARWPSSIPDKGSRKRPPRAYRPNWRHWQDSRGSIHSDADGTHPPDRLNDRQPGRCGRSQPSSVGQKPQRPPPSMRRSVREPAPPEQGERSADISGVATASEYFRTATV